MMHGQTQIIFINVYMHLLVSLPYRKNPIFNIPCD